MSERVSNEAEEKQNGQSFNRWLQDGGALSKEDIEVIKKETGIAFDDETAERLFARRGETKEEKFPEVNLGRYKEVGYFDVLDNKNDGFTIANTRNNPHNVHTVKNLIREIQGLNPGREVNFQYRPEFKEGGKFQGGAEMDLSKKLTGDYMEGLANKNPEQAVAEAEDGEFILHKDGQVVEIQGNKHGKAGGEKMTADQVQEGDKFISNHRKFAAKEAKQIAEQYGVKINTKDTYADGLRKIRKQIGLTSIIEEKEEIIKSIEKSQKAKHDNTMKLNLEFQSKKLQELQAQEEDKKMVFQDAVSKIFDVQEAGKPKQPGTSKFEDGGAVTDIDPEKVAKRYNVSVEAAQALIDSGAVVYDTDEGNSEAWKLSEVFLEAKGKPTPEMGEVTEKPVPKMGEVVEKPSPQMGEVTEEGKNWWETEAVKGKGDQARLPNLPDQSVLPPNSMAAHTKNNYRFNRIEAGQISPEEALAEIGSQLTTGMDQANQRPDSMRAALLAQMLAGAQKQSNQAITQTNMANQQSQNQAEAYNAQVGDREMIANNQENLRFEQIQMRAKENTDMDWRDYLDYNRKVQLNNYNTVNQMNLMNELFDKFELVDGQVRQKSGTHFEAKVPGLTNNKG